MATCQTLSEGSVGLTGAVLNGSVNPQGQPTEAWFEYGPAAAGTYPSTTPRQSVGSGSSSVAVTATVTSLTSGTNYHYRIVAETTTNIAPYADSPNTFKGVHIQGQSSGIPTSRPSYAELNAVGVGAVRAIYQEAYHAPVMMKSFADYIKSICDPPSTIFPIICIDGASGVSATEWQTRIEELVATVKVGIFEIGNEEGKGYKYPGATAGTDWNKWLNAAQVAADIIHTSGNKCLLGAALDVETGPYLNAAQSRTEGKGRASNWVDGFAVHPYGQSSATWNRGTAVNAVHAKCTTARNIVPRTHELWITEMGWGCGGNVNSTLVALASNTAKTTLSGNHNGILGTTPSFTINVNGIHADFPNSGRLFVSPGARSGQSAREVHYASKGASQFLGCTGGGGGGDGLFLDNAPVSLILDPTAAKITEVSLALRQVYNELWDRRYTTDAQVPVGGKLPSLNLKNIGYFIWGDYAYPTGFVSTWADYCGIRDYNDNIRADIETEFSVPAQPRRLPLT